MYLRPALQENLKDVGVDEGRVNGWKGPLEGPLADARRSLATETEPATLVLGGLDVSQFTSVPDRLLKDRSGAVYGVKPTAGHTALAGTLLYRRR